MAASIRTMFNCPLPTQVKISRNYAIMLTDIVGSSALYDKHGDAVGLGIAMTKFGIARDLLGNEPFNDRIGVLKTMGDALLCVADTVAIAVLFAQRLGKRLRDATEFGVCIRSTIHFGSFYVHTPTVAPNVNDIFGEKVNRTARYEQASKDLCKKIDDASFNTLPILLSQEAHGAMDFGSDTTDERVRTEVCHIREQPDRGLTVFLLRDDFQAELSD